MIGPICHTDVIHLGVFCFFAAVIFLTKKTVWIPGNPYNTHIRFQGEEVRIGDKNPLEYYLVNTGYSSMMDTLGFRLTVMTKDQDTLLGMLLFLL